MVLFEIAAFFLSLFKNLLAPYVNWLVRLVTSPAITRKAVQALVACIAFGLLVCLAMIAYFVFYWVYIPQLHHVGYILFQYELPTPGVVMPQPYDLVEFPKSWRGPGFLRGGQEYDISVLLDMPTSPKNVDIGNFMVTIKLLNSDGDTIAKSSIPAIIKQFSLPSRVMHTLRWSPEERQLEVVLMESFVENSSNPVSKTFVQVSNPDLQIYRATLHFDAHFHGLRYWMFYNRITSALILTFGFWLCETIFAVSVCVLLTRWSRENSVAAAPSTVERDSIGPIVEKELPAWTYKELEPGLQECEQDAQGTKEFPLIPEFESRTDDEWLQLDDAVQTVAPGKVSENTNDIRMSKKLRRRKRLAYVHREFEAPETNGGPSTPSFQQLEPNTRSTALP
ncbi:hypothetical protein BGZ52_008961 [Haplosporangium bisporale]|nr:hypothetical protein BGZ52_008961 [Haplosporangium bisporale]KFH70209.1 hypothetical protein MVEG_05011 [Podila verticillata NRRL 6337]